MDRSAIQRSDRGAISDNATVIYRTILTALFLVLVTGSACGGVTHPVLDSVYPAGGSAGQIVRVTVTGSNLDELKGLHCNAPGIQFQQRDKNQFDIFISEATRPGLYDVWALSASGLSSPRPFFVSNRTERLEAEPNESARSAASVPLGVVINGRIEKGGDLDHFRFDATEGQRVVVECFAERIDSQLRAVLEILDANGKILASNRGYFGIDPLVDFRVPVDGTYVVKVYDLIHSGGANHYYRLDIDTGPRVCFVRPSVIEQGKPARVTLYGWNLNLHQSVGRASQLPVTDEEPEQVERLPRKGSGLNVSNFDHVEVDIPAEHAHNSGPWPVRLQPAQAVMDGFAYYFPGGHAPTLIGVTDVPVVLDCSDNHSPTMAQQISFPCEVSGQLVDGDERDWFAVDAKRGEVLYVEAYGQRINSPVDLDVIIFDSTGTKELLRLSDEVRNIGGRTLPTSHLDPAGRWVVPADGRYRIVVRNLIGGLHADPRRTYRLSIRREEPEFHLVAIPRHNDPAALNLLRGGRAVLDVFAFRHRGLNGMIRVSAKNLPSGIECPDVWLGPGINRAVMVITADTDAPNFVADLELEGAAESARSCNVRGGVVVRTGSPNGRSRLTSRIPLAVTGHAPLRITASGQETRDHHLYGELKVRHSSGGILDVAVRVQRDGRDHRAPVKLTSVGLPDSIQNQTAIIPAGKDEGYISFYLPHSLPVGRYSLAIRAETTVADPTEQKTEAVIVYSNPVTFDVHLPAFRLEIDPYAPRRIKRGETVQVNYTARRINGFINKIHTELAAPGKVTDVVGLRGRGVTFVGQTETGTIQIIANDDAPLGQLPFLRLYGVGVVEDEPVFHGGCFLNLEVVE